MLVKSTLTGLFIFFIATTIFAQEPDAIDSVLNELYFEDADLYELFDGNTNFHFLYFVGGYNSGTYYAGRQLGENQHNLTGQMYYFMTNGLYFGASAANYSYLDPSFRSVVVSAGYSNSIRKFDFFRYRLSYDRYVYVNMGTDFEPTYNSDVNAGITLRYKFAGLRYDYTLLIGKETGHIMTLDFFTKFKLLTLGKYDRIQFAPEVSNYYSSELVEYYTNAAEVEANPLVDPIYVVKEEYGLMNTSVTLPLSIAYHQFDFEVSYTYHFPKSLDPAYYYEESGFWGISLAYIISIN